MMKVLNILKNTAKSEFTAAKNVLRVEQLKSELKVLMVAEDAAYAQIGRHAVEADGLEAFGDLGRKVAAVQEQIRLKETQIADAEDKYR